MTRADAFRAIRTQGRTRGVTAHVRTHKPYGIMRQESQPLGRPGSGGGVGRAPEGAKVEVVDPALGARRTLADVLVGDA